MNRSPCNKIKYASYVENGKLSAKNFTISNRSLRTWKFVSLKPGFFAKVRTITCVGTSDESICFMN